MDLSRGDIVIIAPSGDFSKPRPALVMQAYLVRQLETGTVVPFTSDLQRLRMVRIPVDPAFENGLSRPSEIMSDNIQTLLVKRVGSIIGRVDDQTMRRVEASLVAFLGLNVSLWFRPLFPHTCPW